MTRRVFLDIESTSLYADVGHITAVGILSYPEPEIFFVSSLHEEANALEWLKRRLKSRDTVITWHDFDPRYIKARALATGVNVGIFNQIFFFDLCRWFQKNIALTRYSLNEVCSFLGVKKQIEPSNIQMPELYLSAVNGNEAAKQKIIDHCKDDLESLREVYKRVVTNIGGV